MKKVAVIGCGGSGKSYVARSLGMLLDAPVTHLDTVYYDSAWNELPMSEFETRQRAIVAEPSWVIDGNYNSTLPVRLQACDTVVFLDLPTATCLWGAVKRQIRHGAGQNENTGEYNRMHWGVVRYIRSYRQKMRPKVLRKLEENAGYTTIRLTSRHQVRRWLAQLTTDQDRP